MAPLLHQERVPQRLPESLTAKMLEQCVQKEVDELNEWRRVIKSGLKRMAQRRAKKVFDARRGNSREAGCSYGRSYAKNPIQPREL